MYIMKGSAPKDQGNRDSLLLPTLHKTLLHLVEKVKKIENSTQG